MKAVLRFSSIFKWLLLLTIGALSQSSFAQNLQDGRLYQVVHPATGLVLSNGEKMENDAPILLEKANAELLGQQWILNGTGVANEFALQNLGSLKGMDILEPSVSEATK